MVASCVRLCTQKYIHTWDSQAASFPATSLTVNFHTISHGNRDVTNPLIVYLLHVQLQVS
jgi:hypothetical protein